MTNNVTFNPKQVAKNLISVLPERSKDIIEKRFGLGKNQEKMTLEAIGQIYGITRERVRQIENHALNTIVKTDQYKKEEPAFKEMESLIHDLGGVVPEDEFLSYISSDENVQNYVHFLLVIGDKFSKEKEDQHFKHRWHVDEETAEKVHEALKGIYKELSNDDLLNEEEMVSKVESRLNDIPEKHKNEDVIKRWLNLSKKVEKNPLGEWGRAESTNVTLKGMRDYAYLVLRDHGSPMHFREVAEKIEEIFDKSAHVATCHNELIKDDRFVLVGRGLYALKDWGYSAGVVKDVIVDILEKQGPLPKDEIIELVLKERYVKPNTVVVNLQDTDTFEKDEAGRYSLK